MNRTPSPRPLSLLAALTLTLAAPLAWAQTSPTPPPSVEAPDAPLSSKPEPTKVTLSDGTVMTGRIVNRNPDMLTMELQDGSITSVSSDRVVSVSGPGQRAPAAATSTGEVSSITLSDGQVILGRIISRDEQNTVVELGSGARMTLSSNSINEVKTEKGAKIEEGKVWLPDANRTRYLYAPSAMMLRQGEGYFSQKELFFSAASVGITDNISLLAGAVVPAWFVPSGFNFIFAAKVGFSLNENFHLAGGAETIVLPFVSGFPGAGFVFAAATVGGPNLHGTIAVGRPFAFSTTGSQSLGEAIITLNGAYRINNTFGLVSENWIFPGLYSGTNDSLPVMFNGLAGRIMLGRFTLDLGFIRLHTAPFPAPWLDVAYHWG
ncbi:MAG TPA: hypothetical protein VK447_17555 [Myxococcaceae bacterium]|nr:hypothetical protein [Myxococcaceae bacterium]